MQGILRSHYKLVKEYLDKLQEENATNPFCPYYETILQHKEKLTEIYENYREAFEQMALIINQFEEHKLSVKRLLILQKKKKKQTLKVIPVSAQNNISKKEKATQ
jgi:uncharacterized protein YlaN (UPF0358 family)